MYIGIDFDGTVVKHAFPNIGEDIGAVPVLKNLVKNGHKLILTSMRSHRLTNGIDTLTEAENWFKSHDIELFGVNNNPTQKRWTDSPKPYANLYIDDASLGCPLKMDEGEDRPYVDWKVLDTWFKSVGLISTVIA